MARPSLHPSRFLWSGYVIGNNLPHFTSLSGISIIIVVREEHTVALVSNLSKDSCRGARWSRDKFEALLMRRPANGCCVFNEIADELVRLVAELDSSRDTAPTDAEGDVCGYGGATLQGVHNVGEVPGLQVAKVHRSRCFIEVDLYALIGDAYGPKQATGKNTGVVVVDFILRGQRLLRKEIQSDEAEGAPVLFPVHPNVDPLHEPIVHVEEERSGGASSSVCSCPSTLYVCDAHESVKIEDRRWLGTMYGREEVKNLRPCEGELDAAGNGSWSDLIILVGMRNCW
jgi:hypothetical protein